MPRSCERFHILVSVRMQRAGAAKTAVRWHRIGPEAVLAGRNLVKPVLIASDRFGAGFESRRSAIHPGNLPAAGRAAVPVRRVRAAGGELLRRQTSARGRSSTGRCRAAASKPAPFKNRRTAAPGNSRACVWAEWKGGAPTANPNPTHTAWEESSRCRLVSIVSRPPSLIPPPG
jgi:hypothetical protein